MSLALGIVLAVSGGASLALAMVTQRYSLDPLNQTTPGKVPLFGKQYNSTAVWVFGLILYGGANALYAMALLYGPLSLLAGCFTTLLIFNLIFARCLLEERISPPKVVGSIAILGGVVASIVATPSDVATEFTPRDIEELISKPVGATYCAVLVSSVLICVALIMWYEATYPLPSPQEELDAHSKDTLDATTPQPESRTSAAPAPPLWLDRAMSVVYPGSLGLDEGICHLTLKACVSMLDTCGDAGECWRPTMLIFFIVWIGTSVATLWWLRRVFTRYETTRALPVEYGAVNAVSACSGLVFYREHTFMKPWQVTTMCVGLVAILSGIAIGNTAPLDRAPEAPKGQGASTNKVSGQHEVEVASIAPPSKEEKAGESPC